MHIMHRKRQGIKDISGCRGYAGGAPLCVGKAEGYSWMIVTLLLSRRFTATESWAVQLSGLREAV